MCKVQWSHHTEEEATWKREDLFRSIRISGHTEEATWERDEELKVEFPSFFFDSSESWGRDSF
jgi:hypothetical protein